MLEPLALVPLVEAFEEQRLKLQRVVRRWIGHAHKLGEHKKHKEIVLLASRPCHCPSVGGFVELAEEAAQLSQATLVVAHLPRP